LNLQKILESVLDSRGGPYLMDLTTCLMMANHVRRPLLSAGEKIVSRFIGELDRSQGVPERIIRERQLSVRAVIQSLNQCIEKGYLSPHLIRAITELWGRALCAGVETKPALKRFKEENGVRPPWLIAISPGHSCNLRCTGCYSASDGLPSRLPWSTVDRVITEAKELWGIFLVVFTGGEPLAYRSEGKDLVDLMQKHNDLLFVVFTNGTLLDRGLAHRMAVTNNMTTAVSVEGMRESTDAVRGKGVFDQALEAIEVMHEVGITVGISSTATRDNCCELLSDEFLDFFFQEMGVFYGFIFQYMPIGREGDPARMPSPEQRLWMWERGWEVLERKKYFMFDFWNYGTLVHGCVSAGREKGYLHLDWDGNITPCVFAPYSVGNIQKLYAEGGNLNDIWQAPFFAAIRDWQMEHGYGKESLGSGDNWLTPCPIRDYHGEFRQWLERYRPEPEPGMISNDFNEDLFHDELVRYGDEVRELLQPIWQREYLGLS
jgi:MoaA/NifB/PqqE/SkfB family radical SAM enzyme